MGQTVGATRIRTTDEGSVKPCDRCGRRTRRNPERDRKPHPRTRNLRLCVDCKDDKWFIERAGTEQVA